MPCCVVAHGSAGQPGTGKAELIQQAVRHYQMELLVVAASNVAVDTV
jgi:Ni2+-binding GTPase involved in maturation of urease and hydrogenase